MKPNKL